MREAITQNTILLVASAPRYSHGAIDPITDIAALARSNVQTPNYLTNLINVRFCNWTTVRDVVCNKTTNSIVRYAISPSYLLRRY